jgi:Tfp pilus assembly protein PilF
MLPAEGEGSLYTLSVVLLCRPENVPGEAARLSGVEPVFVEAVEYRGQTCFRLCAGLSRTREGLAGLQRRLPEEVKAHHPFVVALERPCPKMASPLPASPPAAPEPPENPRAAAEKTPVTSPSSPAAVPPLPPPSATELSRPGEKEAEAWFKKGVAAYTQGRRQEAESCYREALRADPSKPEVLNNLGVLRLEEKRYEEARDLFRRALERAPRYARARLNLAGAQWALGERDGAVEEALRASELDPQDVATHLTLASFYLALGKKTEARAEAQRALALDPANEQAQVFAAAAGMEGVP